MAGSLNPVHCLVPFTERSVGDDDLVRRGTGEPVIRERVILLGTLEKIVQFTAEIALNRVAAADFPGLTGQQMLHAQRNRQIGGEHLDGREPIEVPVMCTIDDSHSASADLFIDPEPFG